jgi:hypothetical protein
MVKSPAISAPGLSDSPPSSAKCIYATFLGLIELRLDVLRILIYDMIQ